MNAGLHLLAVAALATNLLAAGVDAHLRLGIPGGYSEPVGAQTVDASVPSVAGWFPVQMLRHPIIADTTWTNGLIAVGKPTAGSFSFTKNIDFASPYLLNAITTGRSFDKAQLTVRQTGSTTGPFYSVLLKDVYLRSVTHNADAGQPPREQIEAIYSAIEWIYQARDAKNEVSFSARFNWNVVSGVVGDGPASGVQLFQPVAGTDRVTRFVESSLTIPIANLLLNDSPDSIFAGLAAGETSLGARITQSRDQLFYPAPSPENSIADQFRYTLRNLAGQTSEGIVNIQVQRITDPRMRINRVRNIIDISVPADAGITYQLQVTSRLGDPWTNHGAPVTVDSLTDIHWGVEQTQTQFFRVLLIP